MVLTNGILNFDELNAPLRGGASYWVRPIKSPAAEAARGANGLVKIVWGNGSWREYELFI